MVEAPAAEDPEALRGALRDAVAILAGQLREPVAHAVVRRRVEALVDLGQRGVTDTTTIAVVVAGRDRAGTWRERLIDTTAPGPIRAAAAALVAEAPAGDATPLAIGAPEDRAVVVARDPAAMGTADWSREAEALAERAAAGASSRIVYRAAYVTCDDERHWVVTAAVDRSQRLVRTRIGATAVAWQGTAPIAGTAERVGGLAPDQRLLSDDDLARARADALAFYDAAPIEWRPEAEVILAPALVAAIVDAAWDRATAWGAATVADDPTVPGGYASYFFDDLGAVPAPLPLGGTSAPSTGRLRRDPVSGRLVRAPSNLVMQAGALGLDGLEALVADGLIVDGAVDLRMNARGELAVRAARARELTGGKRSGRSWRDVELRGDAAAILGAIRAVGDRPEAVAPPDDTGPARAIVVPWVATRAGVGPARGDA